MATTTAAAGSVGSGAGSGAGNDRRWSRLWLPLRLLWAPFSRRAWRDTAFIAAGVPLALPSALTAVLVPGDVFGWGLLGFVTLLLLCHQWLTRLQRDRFRSLLGLEIPVVPEREGHWLGRGTLRWLRSDSTWRQLAYHLLAAPLVSLYAVMVLSGWTTGLVCVTVYGWILAVPPSSRTAALQGRGDFWLTVAGVALLLVVPWAAALAVELDKRAAAALLGPNRARELQRRVESLAESRSGVVDAADAERRRIERDLHDGAQQQLVALAMNLGLARRMLRDLPPEQQAVRAMQAIAEAHQEAQAAIVALRDLVRGLHPVVLEDRGLDAALSGITARAPLPVRLTVDLPERASPAVEAVAYFTVSEALTNIAKHARASHAEVDVRQTRGGPGGGWLLRITVTDDGVGGADAAKGSGLTGLRGRAASVDGRLTITSPLGGPTILTVELPCEP
jgi:signal transduction histidine kinase